MSNPYLRRFNRATNRLGDVVSIDTDIWGVSSISKAAEIAQVNRWIVTRIKDNVFTCTCPDYLGQVIIGNDLENIKVDFEKTFYPCKHILAVTIVGGFDYPNVIVENLSANVFDSTFDFTFRRNTGIFDFTFDFTFQGSIVIRIFDNSFSEIFG